jgi:hypothetical protein
MRNEGNAIQGLWIGRPLSLVERLSITSFLHHGHEYHLYCYEDVGNVPAGTVIRDAGEILPSSEIFFHQSGGARGSVGAYSDLFRYKLLLERGGWWVDTDVVCLRPFDFPEEVLFAAEHAREGGIKITGAVIKQPPGHPFSARCWEAASKAERSKVHWGAIGPELVTRTVLDLDLARLVAKPEVFFPIPWWDWHTVLADDPQPAISNITDHTHAIHLWHELWRRASIDLSGPFPPTSLFSELLRRFQVAS